MKYLIVVIALIISFGSIAYAASPYIFTSGQEGNSPANGYVLQTNGSVSTWVATSTLGISGGGTSGVGTVSTSSAEIAGYLPYWTSTSGYPATLGKVATSSLSISGPFTVQANTFTVGVGGSVTYWGLSTTSQPSSSNLLVSNGVAGVYGVSTSTLTASSPLTGSLVQVGSSGSLGCQTASGSQAGCLSSADWTTFNGKLASVSADYPLQGAGTSASHLTLAFGTSTSNTWGGTQTFSNPIVDGSLSGFIAGNSGTTYSIASSSLDLPNTALQNSTISGISLGSNLNALTATDGTLTFSGSYNGNLARTVGLNLSNANTWSALQQFGNATSTLLTATTEWLPSLGTAAGAVLAVDPNGKVIATTTSSGAVSSVSNSDGTLTISPTTGAVVASLNLSHANTWAALQQFGSGLTAYASSTIGNGTTAGGLTISGGATTTGNANLLGGTTNIGSASVSPVFNVWNSGFSMTIVPGPLGLTGNRLAEFPDASGVVVYGTGAANRVSYWTGQNSISSTANFAFDGTNLGIGTSTPFALLSVQGNGFFDGSLTAANIIATGTLTVSTTTSGCAQFSGSGLLYSTGSSCGSGSGTVTSVSGSGGTTGLTLTGGPITTSGTLTLGGTLGIANGGTATTTFYSSGIVFSDGSKLTQSAGATGSAFDWDNTNFRLGIGTTSPWANLSIDAEAGKVPFAIGSSSTLFLVDTKGNVGIGTTTPSGLFAVANFWITALGEIIGKDTVNGWFGQINPTRSFALQTATTTTWTASTTSSGYSPYLVMPFAGTVRQVRCATDQSFLGVNVQVNGSNATPSYFVASTTVGTVPFTSGNTFTAGQKVLANFGTTTTATTLSVSCTFDVTQSP